MFKLPNGWERKNLGELAAPTPNSFVDGPFGSNLKTDEYTSEGVRLIQLQNIGEGVWLDENQKFISHRKLNQLSRHTAYPGDIAIAKMADPVARACILPGVSEKFVVVADCIKLTPDYTQYDSMYLVYAINHQNVRVQAEQKSIGTTRKRINLSVLKTLKIWIPPLKEQQCIAEILDTIDEAIAHTSSIIAKLKQIKAGLLHDLLTRGLDENGELRDAIAHPEQFKDSPLGKIPKDWEVKSLDTITDLQVGFAFKSEWFQEQEGIKLLRGENVGYGRPDWSETRTLLWNMYPQYREYQLVKGDIIVGMDRTFTKSGCKISVLEQEDLPALLVQRVGRFLPINCERKFLKVILTAPQYHQALLTKQKGMDIPHLSKMEILEPVVAIPPIKEQICIASIIDTHDTRIRTEEAYLEKLKLQKKGLMHDLLTGKVRVNQVKNNIATPTTA